MTNLSKFSKRKIKLAKYMAKYDNNLLTTTKKTKKGIQIQNKVTILDIAKYMKLIEESAKEEYNKNTKDFTEKEGTDFYDGLMFEFN